MSNNNTPAQGKARMDDSAPICYIGCPKQQGRGCAAWVQPATDAPWQNIGTREAPTLVPSYHCVAERGGCGFHGYVVDGNLQDAPPGTSAILPCVACKEPHILRVAAGFDAGGQFDLKLDFYSARARSRAALAMKRPSSEAGT